MLNHILVPNSLICPNGTIDFKNKKLLDLLNQNFSYDEKLVEESEHYSSLKAPYAEVDFNPNDPPLPSDLELHQYFIATKEIPDYAGSNVPANSIVLRFTVSDDADKDVIVLQRYQTFFNYEPTTTSYTYTQSPFDPIKDKCYMRPYGEWARISSGSRIFGTSAMIEVTNQIEYCFKTNDNQTLIAPVWFSADQVCARLYLKDELNAEPIANVPASIFHDTNNGNPKIYLQLHTNSLPAAFYVEVF